MDLWYFHLLNYSKKVVELVVSRDRRVLATSSRRVQTPNEEMQD